MKQVEPLLVGFIFGIILLSIMYFYVIKPINEEQFEQNVAETKALCDKAGLTYFTRNPDWVGYCVREVNGVIIDRYIVDAGKLRLVKR